MHDITTIVPCVCHFDTSDTLIQSDDKVHWMKSSVQIVDKQTAI